MKRPIFPLNLKKVRKSRNLSQQRLSELSGVSYGYICDLENGKYNPSLITLEKLANALGVSVPDLLNKRDDSTAQPTGTC